MHFCNSGDAVNQWRIRVGSSYAHSGGVVHNINQRIIHPSYNANTMANDIAILRSATNFVFNNNVRAASVAGPNYNLPDNLAVWAAGWGDTFVSLLMILIEVLYDRKFVLFVIQFMFMFHRLFRTMVLSSFATFRL